MSSMKQRVARKAAQKPKRKGMRNATRNLSRSVNKALISISGSTGRQGLSSSNVGATTKRGQIIEEDEYIAEVAGSVGFSTTGYAVNPGLALTFPWASRISALYERYEFLELEFYYRREVSEYSSNGQAGKVMLSFDYDASDSSPVSKQNVLDTFPHADAMPCQERISLKLDPKQLLGMPGGRYVRTGTQPPNTDIKTYDAGLLFVSTYGNTSSGNLGELRVKYKCRLKTPVLEPNTSVPSEGIGSQFMVVSNAIGDTAAASAGSVVMFQNAEGPVIVQNNIGATLATTGVVTLQANGVYLVEYGCSAFGSAAAPSAVDAFITPSNTTGSSNFYAHTIGSTTGSGTIGYDQLPRTCTGTSFFLNTSTPVDGSGGVSTLCLVVTATYASGGCQLGGWLGITQISAQS